MSLSPEDKYHLDKWWLLQELKAEYLVSDSYELSTVFHLRENNAPTKLVQERLLKQLASKEAFELEKIDDNSYKVVFLHNFTKAYNATDLWFRDFYATTGIKPEYETIPTAKPELITVRLSKEGRGLWLVAGEDDQVLLNRFASNRPPDLIFGYLINNRPGSLVRLGELKREFENVGKVSNLEDLVRKVGFDKELKKLFFKRSGAKELELTNPIQITGSEWQEIKQKLETSRTGKKPASSNSSKL
ncbi:hypothetical protein DYH10_03780 [Candidatus Saccharibacteria bacterium CPR2]|nr:hypothetical protein [Candidatus Saccharibacteria bacterium CPR2]